MAEGGREAEAIYADPALVALYDPLNGEAARARRDFAAVRGLAGTSGSVLDVGCGTGELAASLGDGRRVVVGADPSEAMLAHARARPGGDRVRWVRAPAEALDLGARFDVVAWTGHAFQCLAGEAAARAALHACARHLAPGGVLLFDTRNPLSRYWERWTPDVPARAVGPNGPAAVVTEAAWDAAAERVTYRQTYQAGGVERRAAMRLFSPSAEALDAWCAEAGLRAQRFGGWDGEPWTAKGVETVIHARPC